MKRIVAATELLLVFPAVLFMTALFVRGLRPLQYEPSHTADQIAMWYAGRQWTLWALLIVLPLIALFIGCATLLRNRNGEVEMRHSARQLLAASHADLASLIIAVTTLAAGGVLARVAVHMLSR